MSLCILGCPRDTQGHAICPYIAAVNGQMAQVPSRTCPCVSWDVLGTLKGILYSCCAWSSCILGCPRDTQGHPISYIAAVNGQMAQVPSRTCPCVSQDVLGILNCIAAVHSQMPQVPSQTCPCVSWDVLETLKDMLYVLRIHVKCLKSQVKMSLCIPGCPRDTQGHPI